MNRTSVNIKFHCIHFRYLVILLPVLCDRNDYMLSGIKHWAGIVELGSGYIKYIVGYFSKSFP